MHAAVVGESRRWVGEVREGQKERAGGMCGSRETTKEISPPWFQSSVLRKWRAKAVACKPNSSIWKKKCYSSFENKS